MKSTAKDLEYMMIDGIDFRRRTLIGLLVFVLVFVVWHTATELMFGIRVLALMEGGFALYAAVLLYLVVRRPYTRWLAFAFVMPALMVILVAMFHPATPANVYAWAFLTPVLAYALLGRQLGFPITLLCSGLALIAYLSKAGGPTHGENLMVTTDVVICLSIIWVISHLYERYRERSIEAFHRMATTDVLTGLQNRRQMEKVFGHLSVTAERQRQALAVVVMDLDHFKQINDGWGHDAGDAVLVHVADLLRKTLRKSDWAFRTGGEEFCLLLPVESAAGAMKAAESVRRAIAETPCRYENGTIELSASIGVAICPLEGTEFEKLLQRGDQSMYRAKQSGRNRVVGTESDAGIAGEEALALNVS